MIKKINKTKIADKMKFLHNPYNLLFIIFKNNFPKIKVKLSLLKNNRSNLL